MGIKYNTSTVRDGLVLQLDAANAKSYPGTGTAIDSLLPKSEIIPNVPFNNTGVWITASWSGTVTGARSFTTTAGGQGLYLSGVIAVGRRYRIKLVLSQCQGTFEIRNSAGAGAGTLLFTTTSPGVYQVDFVAVNSSFYLRAATALAVDFAELSLIEITGTLVNGVGYTSANSGGLIFDGVDDVVVCSDIPFRFETPNFSLSAVVYWTNILQFSGICGKRNGSPFNQYGLVINNNITTSDIGRNLTFFSRRDVSGPDVNLTYTLPNQAGFFNVVSTVSTNVQRLYVNGTLQSQSTLDLSSATYNIIGRNFTIGANNNNTNDGYIGFFPSIISQVSVYNRALTAQEIAQNFEATRGRYNI